MFLTRERERQVLLEGNISSALFPTFKYYRSKHTSINRQV